MLAVMLVRSSNYGERCLVFGLDAFAPLVAAIVLIALFVAFATEWRPPEVSALAAVGVFLLLGIISSDDLIAVFANPAPITIGAMFIMSSALVRTGALDGLVQAMMRQVSKNALFAPFWFLVAVAALSAFVNNTPIVMMLIPVALALAGKANESPSRHMIPLSYAAILGGTITLFGTSTNILVDGVARKAGLEPFHVLEIAPLGLISAILGVALMFIFRRALPERTALAALLSSNDAPRYIVEIAIEAKSKYVGESAVSVKAFNSADSRLVDVIRGDASLRRELDIVVLAEGDIVVLRSPIREILGFKQSSELKGPDGGLQQLSARTSILVEILLAPGANFIGKSLRHLRLRRRYGVYPVALHRRSANLSDRLEYTPLEVGDTLLIEGAPEDLKRLCDDNELVDVAMPRERALKKSHAPIAIFTVIGVVALAGLGVMSISSLAVIGAAIVLAARCVEADEAFGAVDWRILSLIFAMLAVGAALENAGLMELIVANAAPYLSATSPRVALAAVYLLSMLLTEMVTNNAVAIIMTPVAIGLAQTMGLEARPFVVAVMFAASASFMTPIGYQTNTLVYSVGGYKFTDYLRLGAPLSALCMTIAVLIIPVIWPF